MLGLATVWAIVKIGPRREADQKRVSVMVLKSCVSMHTAPHRRHDELREVAPEAVEQSHAGHSGRTQLIELSTAR
jgi:hypothetical protein